jgi:hypothetical protein
MVKDSDIAESEESKSIDYRDVVKVVTRSVSKCILVYVTADTARRAIMYFISAKV